MSLTTARTAPKGKTKTKADALEAVTRADILDEPQVRLPTDIPNSYKRRLNKMKSDSLDNVSIKMFVLEALEDLFDKYEKNNGRYEME